LVCKGRAAIGEEVGSEGVTLDHLVPTFFLNSRSSILTGETRKEQREGSIGWERGARVMSLDGMWSEICFFFSV
jgi:hypothetical protein